MLNVEVHASASNSKQATAQPTVEKREGEREIEKKKNDHLHRFCWLSLG